MLACWRATSVFELVSSMSVSPDVGLDRAVNRLLTLRRRRHVRTDQRLSTIQRLSIPALRIVTTLSIFNAPAKRLPELSGNLPLKRARV